VGQEGIHVLDNSSNVLIEDCHVYDTRQWQFNGEGIYVGTGSGGPLDNTNNITIRNNLIHDTIDEGIELKPATHDCIVEGNTLYNIETASWFGAIEVGPTQLGAQSYGSNPNHIIRDNMIYDSDTAIVLDTGSQCYNNTIYNLSFDAIGILVDDPAADGYTMYIHHNTIDLPLARAYETQGGTSVVTNNIGPNLASNTPVDNAFFLAGVGNYQLAAGASVIDIGVMVTPTVINDDGYGNARMIGSKSDYGAHEFGGIFPMTNIQNFDVPLTFGTNDVITWAYVQPGDGWEDAAGNDLVGLSNQSVTNDSTQASQGGGGGTVPRAPKGVGVSSGFFQ
jgi:parallel beta-helix repeat protein